MNNDNSIEITDEQELKKYYITVYESKEYKEMIRLEEETLKPHSKVNDVADFFTGFLLVTIYFSLYLFWKFLNPFYFLMVIIPIAILKPLNTKCKNESKQRDEIFEKFRQAKNSFCSLKSRIENPNLQEVYLAPEIIQKFLEIFELGLAKTYTEAIEKYHQQMYEEEVIKNLRSISHRAASVQSQIYAEQKQKELNEKRVNDERVAREESERREREEQRRREDEYWRRVQEEDERKRRESQANTPNVYIDL